MIANNLDKAARREIREAAPLFDQAASKSIGPFPVLWRKRHKRFTEAGVS